MLARIALTFAAALSLTGQPAATTKPTTEAPKVADIPEVIRLRIENTQLRIGMLNTQLKADADAACAIIGGKSIEECDIDLKDWKVRLKVKPQAPAAGEVKK